MLQDLHIKGFKGFRDLQLTDLSRVTLVGGKNNVGKTSLLEAIFLCYDTADPAMFFRHLGWRGIEISLTDAEALFSPIFTDFNMGNTISFELKDGIYTTEMSINFNPSLVQKSVSVDISNVGATATPLKTDAITATSYHMNIHYGVFGIGQEEVAIVLRQTPTNISIQFEPHPVSIRPSGMLQNAVFFPLRMKVDSSEDATRFSQLDIKRGLDRVVNFLRVIEPQLIGLTSVVMPHQKPTVYADIKGMDRKVPVALLGDGMSKLLSIILAIATVDHGVILIDEIDAGFHHSVLPKVWEGIFKAAKDFNCQIIATTHSYECLQAAYDGSSKAQAEEDFSYIRLESHENNIIAKRFSHAVLGAALEHGWEVR
jgi:AAA15 family ATPase/GTPase